MDYIRTNSEANTLSLRTFKTSDLAAIPFIDANNIGDRVIPNPSFYKDGVWHQYIPGPHGLIDMHPVDMIESTYFAASRAGENDIYLTFLDFISQHLYQVVEKCQDGLFQQPARR
jgi:hypothetical protein